ncbi:hypothetical protein K2X05_00635 [bacterium]|nr:hypothetical protein [bacterium]
MASPGEYTQEELIRPYSREDRELVEGFRAATFLEGNKSLAMDKFDPDQLNGRILLFFYQGQLVSLSAAEASHYTGDPETACRVCRYHILKEYRKKFLFCGFKMLRLHSEWAQQAGYSVIYWTHDVKNKALNSLYQRKKKYSLGVDTKWFDDPVFKSFHLNTEYLFRVSEKSDMLQFIYQHTLKKDFIWHPKLGVERKKHFEKKISTSSC